jgi:quercetin dioxygenase-like cupin family protein
MRTSGLLAVGGLLLLAAAGAGLAQDPVKAASATHKVLLENERVRVLDIHVPAGGRALTHTHPTGYVAVAMTDCHMRFSYPGGKVSESTLHAGEVVWSDPVTHSAENLGPGECHVLNIEPKDAQAAKK